MGTDVEVFEENNANNDNGNNNNGNNTVSTPKSDEMDPTPAEVLARDAENLRLHDASVARANKVRRTGGEGASAQAGGGGTHNRERTSRFRDLHYREGTLHKARHRHRATKGEETEGMVT